MTKIKSAKAREILDSRGDPTVEVDVILENGLFGRAAVPSGASTGSHEAIELRDGNSRYGGKGVKNAVANVNELISNSIHGKEFDQKSLDNRLLELDGTSNKSKLGANAILGVSMAFSRVAAHEKNQPLFMYFNDLTENKPKLTLPVPFMNIMNGGKHAEGSSDLQEYMIVPHGFKTFSEALRAGAETFESLKKILHDKKLGTLVGDEGGFAPSLSTNEAPIEIMLEAIDKAGYKAGKQISLAIDCAATEFYKNGCYELSRENKKLSTKEMIYWYENLVSKYPIVSIEDGLAEDDWDGWVALTTNLGSKLELVGDDLFVTNIERLGIGIEKHAGNSILIKMNQIGTVTEAIDAINLARKAGYSAIISHRSGETEDTTIADFAVGTGVGLLKTGSLSRTDRVAKYNQLLRIEEELGAGATYAGSAIFEKKTTK
ncbi:MAG: phosphopyruvate hydratase [Candidatus Taylorbacteria bacterium]|nr:phosphopyruvate hydratase [Candidatus Taylorbacteria bacterium]